MIAFLNGQLVPEAEATVSIFDRSFLYGDGLFETIRLYSGEPFRWEQHMARLRQGADFLGLRLPFPADVLLAAARELVVRNSLPESLLRLTISRGVGVRGYSPKGADRPTLAMSLHPATASDPENPLHWRLITSSLRVPAGDLLANFKTCNKLPQVLARAEAESRGADEALLLNTNGEVAEAASSNVFWLDGDTICTTPLDAGILAGVTRAFVIELCGELGWPVEARRIQPAELREVDAVFLTLSTLEIVPAVQLDAAPLRTSPRVKELHRAYRRAVARQGC